MLITASRDYPNTWKIEPDAPRAIITNVVWFDYGTKSCGHKDVQHLHHFHQLDVILDGEYTLTLRGCEDAVGQAGDAWIIPPLIWHGTDCSTPFRWCSFKFHVSPRFWPLLGNTFHRFHIPEHVRACIDSVGQRSTAPAPLLSEQAVAAISLCLIEFVQQQLELSIGANHLDEFHHWLWPLLEKIQDEPSIKWSTGRMANEMNLSPDYFSRCFRRVVGQTPQHYVQEASMRAAAASLLAVPTIPIKRIAEQSGYATVQAFTRAFTQVFKISPAAYRSLAIQEFFGNSH
jgi:AraC-like DNA-binding protein